MYFVQPLRCEYLFSGAGPLDHSLMPMQDLVLRLPHVVSTGVPYSLSYRMTKTKPSRCAQNSNRETGLGLW